MYGFCKEIRSLKKVKKKNKWCFYNTTYFIYNQIFNII